jgi:hypothetical protein
MKYLFNIYLLFSLFCAQGQEIKNIDIIIVIDEQIVKVPLGIEFVIKDGTDSQKIEAVGGYHPGNISLNKSDYDKLISDQTKSIYLKFSYQTYVGNEPYYYSYEIEYNKFWLQDTYNIINIYNLDKRKYRRKYKPISSDKDYAFGLESSGSTLLIKRKR